jgi:hypothetical protein
MSVRNFWLEAHVDGRKTPIGTGPVSRDGGMFLELYIRDEGDIKQACRIACQSTRDGKLCIIIDPNTDLIVKNIYDPKKAIRLETER